MDGAVKFTLTKQAKQRVFDCPNSKGASDLGLITLIGQVLMHSSHSSLGGEFGIMDTHAQLTH
jgi:hypothetical protein